MPWARNVYGYRRPYEIHSALLRATEHCAPDGAEKSFAMKRFQQQRVFLLILAGACLFAVGLATSRRLIERQTSVKSPHIFSDHSDSAGTQPRLETQATAAPDPGPIEAHVIAGGGGTSTGGSIRIEGTVGETGASRAMSGGSMTLKGGFWSILANTADTAPAVNITVSPFSTSKTGVDLVYTFTRFGSSGSAISVKFSVGGTATLGTHYNQTGATSFDSSSGTVTIPQGNTTAAVNVHPIPSSTSEVDRTIILTVTTGSGYNIDNPSVAIGTIVYDNTPVGNPPIIFTEENTTNAAALDSVTFVRAPFRVVDEHNFSSDHITRVILFTSYLGLTQPSASLVVRAGGFDLPVENVGPILIGSVHASYIVVRLPQNLAPGDLLLTVSLGNATSSATILKIAP